MLTKFKLTLATTIALVGGVAGFAAAQGRGGPDRQAMKDKFDTNKDGKLDDAERSSARAARAAKHFARLDKDGDGKLSLDEFKAGENHQGRHGRRGGFRGRH